MFRCNMSCPVGSANRCSSVALTFLVLLALAGELVQSSWPTRAIKVIDENLSADQVEPLREIAQAVCETQKLTDKQIGRISTIGRLADYLSSLGGSDDLLGCASEHLNCLRELQSLLTTSNNNVCSDAKISLIEDFHHRYVSTTKEDAKQRQEKKTGDDGQSVELAPQLIKTFFMHYAMEVSATCKRSLINNIEWDLGDKFADLKEDFRVGSGSVLDKLIGGLAKYFGSADAVNDYDDVVLIWDLVQGSMYDAKNQVMDIGDEMNDPISGEPVKVIAKMQQAQAAHQMQAKCRSRFRPVYEKIILPIIRLADLGYSNTGKKLENGLKELRENPTVARWFSITQICETILPIMILEDPTLPAGEFVLIGREEALEMIAKNGHLLAGAAEALQYEPMTNSFEAYDLLPGVLKVEAQILVDKVKTGVATRDRSVKRVFNRVIKAAKEFLKNKVFNFFVSHKKRAGDQSVAPKPGEGGQKDTFEVTNVGELIESPLDKLTDEELSKLEGSSWRKRRKNPSDSLTRKKNRPRPGDLSRVDKTTAEMLSYKHTKTWSELLMVARDAFYAILPGRPTLLLIGAIIIFFTMAFIFIVFSVGTG